MDIQKKHINDKGDFVVSAGDSDLGIIGKSDIEAKIFPANTITCDMFGSVYYRNFSYKMVTHARIFCLHFKHEFNEKSALFLLSCLKFLKQKFDFANMCSWKKIQNLQITLPTHKNAQIAFDFMESYIRELEAQRIRELEAYLFVAGLNNTTLTDAEIAALNAFEALTSHLQTPSSVTLPICHVEQSETSLLQSAKNRDFSFATQTQNDKNLAKNGKNSPHNKNAFKHLAWQEFKIGDLFNNIQQGARLKQADHIKGDLPFVMAGTINNGISSFIGNENVRKFNANALTIDIFGNVFYRNYKFGASDDVGVFWQTKCNYSGKTMLFLNATISKALSGRFDFGNKLRASKSHDLRVFLPIYENNDKSEIAFDFIENFIKAIEKQAISQVALYTSQKLNIAKDIIARG